MALRSDRLYWRGPYPGLQYILETKLPEWSNTYRTNDESMKVIADMAGNVHSFLRQRSQTHELSFQNLSYSQTLNLETFIRNTLNEQIIVQNLEFRTWIGSINASPLTITYPSRGEVGEVSFQFVGRLITEQVNI